MSHMLYMLNEQHLNFDKERLCLSLGIAVTSLSGMFWVVSFSELFCCLLCGKMKELKNTGLAG